MVWTDYVPKIVKDMLPDLGKPDPSIAAGEALIRDLQENHPPIPPTAPVTFKSLLGTPAVPLMPPTSGPLLPGMPPTPISSTPRSPTPISSTPRPPTSEEIQKARESMTWETVNGMPEFHVVSTPTQPPKKTSKAPGD